MHFPQSAQILPLHISGIISAAVWSLIFSSTLHISPTHPSQVTQMTQTDTQNNNRITIIEMYME